MTIGQSRNLNIGGCDVCELTELSPFPIYVLDENLLGSNMQNYVQSLKKYYPCEAQTYYATKAMRTQRFAK